MPPDEESSDDDEYDDSKHRNDDVNIAGIHSFHKRGRKPRTAEAKQAAAVQHAEQTVRAAVVARSSGAGLQTATSVVGASAAAHAAAVTAAAVVSVVDPEERDAMRAFARYVLANAVPYKATAAALDSNPPKYALNPAEFGVLRLFLD